MSPLSPEAPHHRPDMVLTIAFPTVLPNGTAIEARPDGIVAWIPA